MRELKKTLYNLRRKLFGKYELDDPRPIAKSAPYTFFLPISERLDAIETGDIVQLIFRSVSTGWEWGAERMWVQVTDVYDDKLKGVLDNDPFDIPQLKAGDEIEFQKWNVIDVQFHNQDKEKLYRLQSKQYWNRCIVDKCVLDGSKKVHLVYREEPDPAPEDDKYPDSGWRIRGDYRGLTDEELADRPISYIALGKVLNEDDSWIHLIEKPIGDYWERNFDTNGYEFLPE
ncbi:immunity protein Imm33 domain-containing protein [Litorimonas sp.]|uniref:immunity protein Imm33 domain-containing protein n=1 Tax=Litorimonas sp. TaxID=1892381 RepID=UPI003A853A0B